MNAITLRSMRVLEVLEVVKKEIKNEVEQVGMYRDVLVKIPSEEKESEEQHVEVQVENVFKLVEPYKPTVPCP